MVEDALRAEKSVRRRKAAAPIAAAALKVKLQGYLGVYLQGLNYIGITVQVLKSRGRVQNK